MKVPRFLLLLTCATVFAVGAGLVRADGGPKPTMTAPAPSARTFLVTPKTKPDGGKWRIGYYESSNYKLYPQTLLEIARGLQHMGWMDEKPDVPDDLSGEDLWRWLARHARSDTLEFVEDAYWQSSDTGGENEPRRLAARESFRKRVETRGDLALVIAMGTAAGQ
ncbi:MAG: hypothetical protein LBQ62_08880, partial [Candidatus Accumulibacter sp.]|nr:hypothetical protein [Accumulibacter sp.]